MAVLRPSKRLGPFRFDIPKLSDEPVNLRKSLCGDRGRITFCAKSAHFRFRKEAVRSVLLTLPHILPVPSYHREVRGVVLIEGAA